jgi:hypothetical protein
MYTVWHVDKYKITFKLFINWTNEILQHIVVSLGLSRPGIIYARARYRAAARRLRNTAQVDRLQIIVSVIVNTFITVEGVPSISIHPVISFIKILYKYGLKPQP